MILNMKTMRNEWQNQRLMAYAYAYQYTGEKKKHNSNMLLAHIDNGDVFDCSQETKEEKKTTFLMVSKQQNFDICVSIFCFYRRNWYWCCTKHLEIISISVLLLIFVSFCYFWLSDLFIDFFGQTKTHVIYDFSMRLEWYVCV